MTHEEAARILDPDTTQEALAEIEYYAGFRGEEAMMGAVNDARRIAVDALRKTSPANIDREAWKPCGECEKRNCDNCLYSEYLSSIEPCKSCYNAKQWKPMQRFCGECGRPLTPEAWAELEKRLRG